MFSFIPNLGLLSRQRVQLLPFLFALLVGAEAVQERGTRVARITLRAAGPYSPGRLSPVPQTVNSMIMSSPPRVHGT
jgi:hypothetical protein